MESITPYLLRALFEWIVDNEQTPCVVVDIDSEGVEAPREFAQNGRIIINIAPRAASNLVIGNEELRCQARFSGIARSLVIPINSVLAIYAQESGAGATLKNNGGNFFTLDSDLEDHKKLKDEEPASDKFDKQPPRDDTPSGGVGMKRGPLRIVK